LPKIKMKSVKEWTDLNIFVNNENLSLFIRRKTFQSRNVPLI
jgi:hypothetical protein